MNARTKKKLTQLLDKLSTEYWVLAQLIESEGLSIPYIARELKISKSTLYYCHNLYHLFKVKSNSNKGRDLKRLESLGCSWSVLKLLSHLPTDQLKLVVKELLERDQKVTVKQIEAIIQASGLDSDIQKGLELVKAEAKKELKKTLNNIKPKQFRHIPNSKLKELRRNLNRYLNSANLLTR